MGLASVRNIQLTNDKIAHSRKKGLQHEQALSSGEVDFLKALQTGSCIAFLRLHKTARKIVRWTQPQPASYEHCCSRKDADLVLDGNLTIDSPVHKSKAHSLQSLKGEVVRPVIQADRSTTALAWGN